LAAALASREEPLSGFEEGANPRDIIRHVFACNRRSLEDTQRVADPASIEKAARVIHKARRLYLLGVGASGLVAQQGATRFMSLGLPAQALQDPYLQVFVTSNLSKSDVVVCVSHTGRTRSVVESLQSAAEHGARTVAITNYPQSPLANAAELVLVTSFDEQRANAAVSSSHIAQLCLLDALYFVIGSWRSRGATALAEVAEDRVQRLLR